MSDKRRTLEQERAAHALECVRKLEKDGGYGNYRSYVERLPAQIVMNGLGQAIAMVRSHFQNDRNDKKRDADREEAKAYRLLYEHLSSWLCRHDETAPYSRKQCLLTAIVEQDQDTYVRAHAEALAYLEWLKKFARAFLDSGKETT